MDGDLRALFRTNMPSAQWTSVETGLTARGVPDAEFCFPGGIQGWVECKGVARGWSITKSTAWPFQVGWIDRRTRLGGRAFVAVRRRTRVDDELWLVDGRSVRQLAAGGLKSVDHWMSWLGGPSRWDWSTVEKILRGERSL